MTKVEIYTKAYCPFCVRAKQVLTSKGVTFKEYPIDQQPELRDLMIERANGRYTVPQIFIDDLHIGGCDDMLALDAQGRLDELLAA
ncbi:glutaredoxin 3 [Bowmanella sp. Y26]|uniref:Glutaredoxin n=1 Tax=Bowmanella yangjiangensis TaxID=2811230 RepID=A0ABS3CSW3_9ALTE|nr:glutaredoxin 3 [Bowmanella yangjiangensis]MBN7819599.1 glutaredoxin 3 [Bowmanella yangjiangensis]MBT1064234.1 glutaredoxin 3 [Bowmanella yangjiangensis]